MKSTLDTTLCPYAVGQIIHKDNGTREIVTNIHENDGAFCLTTEVLTDRWAYYEVGDDGSLNALRFSMQKGWSRR